MTLTNCKDKFTRKTYKPESSDLELKPKWQRKQSKIPCLAPMQTESLCAGICNMSERKDAGQGARGRMKIETAKRAQQHGGTTLKAHHKDRQTTTSPAQYKMLTTANAAQQEQQSRHET